MNGSGTESDPYLISTIDDLNLLAGEGYASYTGSDIYFELTNDIDFMGGTYAGIGTNDDYLFSGHFNGNNHWIRNMNMSSDVATGFFRVITGSVQISNLKFWNCTIEATNVRAGVLAGYGYDQNGSTISNIEVSHCHISSVNGTAGGLMGQGANVPSGTVSFSDIYVHDGEVTTPANIAGGVFGSILHKGYSNVVTASNIRVERMYVAATGSTSQQCGGFSGILGTVSNQFTVSNCSVSDCVVYSGKSYVGGFGGVVGTLANAGAIKVQDCTVTNTCVSSVSTCCGAFLGGVYLNPVTLTRCKVEYCTVVGDSRVAGLAGVVNGTNSSVRYFTETNCEIRNCTFRGITNTTGGCIGQTSSAGYYLSGGTQDSNNVYSPGSTAGINISGYTNQTSVADMDLTATGLSASVSGNMVTFTLSERKGALVCLDSTTNQVYPGAVWTYRNSVSANTISCFDLFRLYRKAGTYTPKVAITNFMSTTPIELTCSSSLVISQNLPGSSNHDQSLMDKNLGFGMKAHSSSTHDESFYQVV